MTHGQTDERTTASLHGGDKRKEHQTRAAGEEVPVQPWLSLQTEPPSTSRTSRHRFKKIQDSHLRERMLLARPRWMQILCHTEKQYRILENEDRTQQNKRRRNTDEACRDGMAFHQYLGMPTET